MPTSKSEWFLAPRDIAPNSTITLGKLIVDPFKPEGPPYLAKAFPTPVESTTEFNYPWTHETERVRGAMLGILASFLAIASADVSGNVQRGVTRRLKAARLQTLKFEPPELYLTQTMNAPENLRFLEDSLFRRSVYIVTGVKTAYGGTIERSNSREVSGEASVGIDPSIPGLEVGPKVGLNQLIKDREEIGAPIDFVYAFRVNKIHYSRRRKRYVQEKYVKGDMLSEYSRMEKGGSQYEVLTEHYEAGVDVVGLEEEDAGVDEFEAEGQDVVDDEDGEVCVLVKPTS